MVLEPRDPPGRSLVGMQWLEKIFLVIIIASVARSASFRWPEIDSGTCLLHSSVALQRSQYQVTERLHRGKCRRCKTPQHHHTNRFIHQQQQLPPPRRRSKWKTGFSECHRSGQPPPQRPLGVPKHAREKKIGINSPSIHNVWQSSGYGYEHTIFRISVARAGFKSGVPLIPHLSRCLDLFSRSITFLGKLCTQRTTFFTTVGSVPTSKKT